MRLRAGVFGMAMLLGVLVGCTHSKGKFTGEFAQVALQEAPADLQALHNRSHMAAGLFVLTQSPDTFLLLCAGKQEGGNQRIEVLEVRPPAETAGEVRVLATLRPGPRGEEYPCVAVRLEKAENLRFKVRLNTTQAEVIELRGIPVVDR